MGEEVGGKNGIQVMLSKKFNIPKKVTSVQELLNSALLLEAYSD
jgi:hypothetical protein